jgi:tRNA pseudouridine38-40 synthase
MSRVKLVLEYDGTDYVGWQIQQNGTSIQAVVEKALASLIGQSVETRVAGRTDSGVHALGQVVCFDCPRDLPLTAFQRGLSGLLPRDVTVREASFVADDFDPRRDSRGKLYRYLISNRNGPSPLRRRTHWEVFPALDVEAMATAGQKVLGRHDFSAFRAADCDALHAVREVRSVLVERGAGENADQIRVEVNGTAFLKHMVRNLVGSLVEVGKGRRPPEWMEQVLRSKDRTLAGPTAPVHGLTLVQVFYP